MSFTANIDDVVAENRNYLLGKHPQWQRVRLKEIATILNGYPFESRGFKKSGGTPLIRIRDIIPGKTETFYEGEFDPAFLVNRGEILVGMDGDFHCEPWTGEPALLNQRVCKITPEESRYAKQFLRYVLPGYLRAINEQTPSVTVKHLSSRTIADIPLPLPPLLEQQRIVAEIEKQFTRLDAGVAALRRVRANLKRYRAAVLKAACEGRLVPTEAELATTENRKYEPATELIARTPTPQRPNWWNSRSKDVIPGHPALAVGNPQTELPEGWTWSALVEIAKMESGHTPSRNHPEWWDGDVAWIGIADAREHDGRTIHETLQHTNLEGIANSASRLLPASTVCISRTASVGYVVVMGREMATSQDFVNWIPTPAVTSDWLRIIFSADREALRRFGKGSVHKTIYFPEWLSMHVAIPPLAEQTRIVSEVERRLSVVEELEAVVSANLQRATGLRQSILQKAFTGELVVQSLVLPTNVIELPNAEHNQRPNAHFARALLSAEIVHRLHREPTFGRIKHQKIFHLCEHIARMEEIDGQYHREAAGPLDNKLIYANEAELKKQKWYQEVPREAYGHAYEPLANAGNHRKYVEGYWPDKLPLIEQLIELMRDWNTDRCEIFCTTYAAWNDLVILGKEPTDAAILREILERWHDSKKRFSEDRWCKAISWIREKGFVPTGFGKPTKVMERK